MGMYEKLWLDIQNVVFSGSTPACRPRPAFSRFQTHLSPTRRIRIRRIPLVVAVLVVPSLSSVNEDERFKPPWRTSTLAPD